MTRSESSSSSPQKETNIQTLHDTTRPKSSLPSNVVKPLPILYRIFHTAQRIYGRRTYQMTHPIVRLSRTRVVKGSGRTTIAEALTHAFITAHTTIPVPKVHKIFRGPHGYTNVIMDYVPGDVLNSVWGDMDATQRCEVMSQLRDFIIQLRAIPPPHPGVVEACGGYPCTDHRIYSEPFGPFDSISDFHRMNGVEWLANNEEKLLVYEKDAPAIRRSYTRSYRSVFSHGDIAPHNIIVQGTRIVALLDWELSGWYPDYWEYVQTYSSNFGWTDGFWECFDREAVTERYPDELATQLCLADMTIRML